MTHKLQCPTCKTEFEPCSCDPKVGHDYKVEGCVAAVFIGSEGECETCHLSGK